MRGAATHLEAVEDAVQEALSAALKAWFGDGFPRNPGVSLFRAAPNQLLGELRKDQRPCAFTAPCMAAALPPNVPIGLRASRLVTMGGSLLASRNRAQKLEPARAATATVDCICAMTG